MKLEFIFLRQRTVFLTILGCLRSVRPSHTLIIVSTTQKKTHPHRGRGEGSEHQLWHTKNMLRLTDKKISLNNWLDLVCLNNYIVENRTDSGNEKVCLLSF